MPKLAILSQHLIDLKTMRSWVLLQLQSAQHDKYPFVCDSMHLAKDQSLLRINATITGFLCSNSRSQQDRHTLWGYRLDEAAEIVPAINRGRNPIVVLGRGRIQWARNALCKKYKATTSKKGRFQKHMLKDSEQNRQSGKPSGARSTKGPLADKKNGGSYKPIRSGRRQTNATLKMLPWLFSQASGAPTLQRHHLDDNSRFFQISDLQEQLQSQPIQPFRKVPGTFRKGTLQ